jgi:hypothetical protein
MLARKDNTRHLRVSAKLKKNGLNIEVRVVASGLTEAQAFDIEKERIAFWRATNPESLVNATDGGDGASGYARPHEVKLAISAALKGVPKPWLRGRRLTPEHRAAISAGGTGRQVSAETRAKISSAQKGKPRPELLGRKLSDAGLERLRNRIFTDEHRRRISEAKRGKPKTPEHRAALSVAMRNKNAKQAGNAA